MADGDSFSPGFLSNTFKEELEEVYDDLQDDIEIKHEPKYAEVMQELFFENDYLTSNTSETESLENHSTNKGSVKSCNMIVPLKIKSEEEDCVLDKITQPNPCVVNITNRLQENVTEPLASRISYINESSSGFKTTQNIIVQNSDGTRCQYILLLQGDNNSQSNIDESNKKDQNYFLASNGIDSNTKTIDVCNESILMKNQSNFSCPQCSYVTKCKSILESHVRSHINLENSSCDGCGFMSTPAVLRNHQDKCESYCLLKNNRNKSRLSCPECSYVTKLSANLKPHIKTHINSKNSSCDGCNFKSTPMALRHHQYKCESYLLKNPLPQRQENNKSKRQSSFICPECSYVAACASNFKLHVKSHKYFENSSCDGCDFKSTPKALSYHQYKCESYLWKNPLPQRPENNKNLSCFSCPKCSYVTKYIGNLERHIKSHINFENSSCDGCDFKSTPKALRNHQYKCNTSLLKNNRNLLRFSCPECSYVTKRKIVLESHIKSHINFKNVSCDGCHFRSTPIALKYHQYKCESYLILKNLLPKRQKNL